MAGFDLSFQHELARNTWVMYSIGMVIMGFRFYSQIRRHGITGLKSDDYLMMLVAILYTTLIVCLNVIVTGGGSNLFLPEQFKTFTPTEIKDRIYGSKIVIISEQAMLNVIYTLKTCLLIMYGRLTNGTKLKRAVKCLACYVAVGWVATEITFFTACRPFKGYWAVPPPNPQCTTLQHYAIVQAVFNISSDLLMLSVPLPMLVSLKLPAKQKVILCAVFSLGIFVITAAILTKVFNLSNVYDTSYMLWYTRESSVAVYVANLPLIWPLLREWIPYLRTTMRGSSYQLPTHESRRRTGGRGTELGTGRVISVISMQAYNKNSSVESSTATLNDGILPDTPKEGKAQPDSISIEVEGEEMVFPSAPNFSSPTIRSEYRSASRAGTRSTSRVDLSDEPPSSDYDYDDIDEEAEDSDTTTTPANSADKANRRSYPPASPPPTPSNEWAAIGAGIRTETRIEIEELMLGSNSSLTNSVEQRRQYMDYSSERTTTPPLPKDMRFEMEQAMRGGREVRIEGGAAVAAGVAKAGGSDAHPGTMVYGPW